MYITIGCSISGRARMTYFQWPHGVPFFARTDEKRSSKRWASSQMQERKILKVTRRILIECQITAPFSVVMCNRITTISHALCSQVTNRSDVKPSPLTVHWLRWVLTWTSEISWSAWYEHSLLVGRQHWYGINLTKFRMQSQKCSGNRNKLAGSISFWAGFQWSGNMHSTNTSRSRYHWVMSLCQNQNRLKHGQQICANG